MRSRKTVTVSHVMLLDDSADIPGLVDDAVIALVTLKGHNKVKTTDNCVQVVLQGFVNNTLDEKLNSVEFEDHLLQKIEGVTPSRQQVKNMAGTMFHNQDIIASVAKIVKKETKKAVRSGKRWNIATKNSSRLRIVLAHGPHRQATDLQLTSPANGLINRPTPKCQKSKTPIYHYGMK